MTEHSERQPRNALGLAASLFLLAVLAVLSPLMTDVAPEERVGALLLMTGVLESLHGFRRSGAAAQRAAWQGAGISILMGVLLINAASFVGGALVLLLAG